MEEINNKPPEEDKGEDGFKSGYNLPGLPPDRKITPQISPVAAAIIGLVGGFFLYQIVGGILTLLVFGFNLDKAPVNGVRLMTMAGQILFILLPALVFSKWFYEDVSAIIRVKTPRLTEIALFTLGIIVLTPLLQNYIYIQNFFFDKLAASSPFFHSVKSFFDSMNDLVEKTYGNLLDAKSIPEGFLVVLVVAVVPALCEEVMFRGFIQRSLEFKLKPVWAALITAVFFGIYHFSPYGLIPLISLGFYFGFAAYKSNSIAVPMFLHFLNNFTAIILYFIYGNDELLNSSVSKDVDLTSSFVTLFLLILAFIGVIILIRKYYSSKRKL